MNLVDRAGRYFAENKDIPAFGSNHFILSVIPVVSLVVERAMFKRAESELLAEMKRDGKISLINSNHTFESTTIAFEFKRAQSDRFLNIAAWHLITGLFQAVPWVIMFGTAPLPRVCFAILYASQVWLVADSSRMEVGYINSQYFHKSRFN